MWRQVSAEEAAAAFLRQKDRGRGAAAQRGPGRVTALIPAKDGMFARTAIGDITLRQMHEKGTEFYIDEQGFGNAEDGRMGYGQTDGQQYIVKKDGEAFARFAWREDAEAYLAGARQSDAGAMWELEGPEKTE